MNNLLLVDHSNIVYRALYANKALYFHGKFVGGVIGYIKMLSKQIKDKQITRIIICQDSKPYCRELEYPNYKKDRTKPIDPVLQKQQQDSFYLISKLLNVLQIQIITYSGAEADDLIALMCNKYQDQADTIYIMSNDSDLYQLLTFTNVQILKQKGTYGLEAFKNEFGIEPHLWPWVTAIGGSHNGVPNIKRGIGPKTALNILKNCKNLRDVLNFEDGEYEGLIKRNLQLATLPYKRYKIRVPIMRCYKEHNMIQFCASLGMAVPGSILENFKKITKSKKL